MRYAIPYHAVAIAALLASILFHAPVAPAQPQQGAEEIEPTGSGRTSVGTMKETTPPGTPDPTIETTDGPNETTAAIPDGTSPEAAEVGAALSREMARMKAEIALVARFAEWQDRLLRTARVDPDEALRQRLAVSECRAGFLAPLCDDLGYLFAPKAEQP